jgi:hypothetical protein
MPSPTRKTVTQLSNLTAGQVGSGELNGPTASITLDSNIDFATTGSTNPDRVPIYIPAPVISAKSGPPIDYQYYEECRSDINGVAIHVNGGSFINGYNVPGSTAQAVYNAPPTVYLHWRGATAGFTSEWLNHNPRYFLYYYTFNQSTYYSFNNPGKVYSPNRNRKWKHPFSLQYPMAAPYNIANARFPYNRTTEWPVENGPLLISALNFSAGPTASWNDGFHPNQYMVSLPGGTGATFFGSSGLFPMAATGSPYGVWGRSIENMDVSRAARQGQVPWQKRITLAFKFRIVIDHPQNPGRLMYGPYSETLLFRPEVGYFTVAPKFGPIVEGIFYYKWGVKVK